MHAVQDSHVQRSAIRTTNKCMQYKTHMSSSCIFSLSCWRKLDISLRTRARLVWESVSSLFRERFSAWMSSSRFRRLASCRSCSSSNLFSPSCKTQHYTRLLLLFVKLVQSFLQNTALHTSIAALRQTCSVLPAKHSITHVYCTSIAAFRQTCSVLPAKHSITNAYCCSSSNLFSPSCKTQHYTSLLLLLVKLAASGQRCSVFPAKHSIN